MEPRICKNKTCRQEFTPGPRSHRQLYCSIKCAQEGWRDLKRERDHKTKKWSREGFVAKCPMCAVSHRIFDMQWTGGNNITPRIYCQNCKGVMGRMNYLELPVKLQKNARKIK